MEHVTCALCDSSIADPFLTTRNFVHPVPGKEDERFTIVKCRTCGLLYTNPRPTEDEIAAYYSGYSVHEIPSSGAATDAVMAVPPRATARSRLSGLLGLGHAGLPDLPPGISVLEVGCATGGYLASLRGRQWSLTGIEPSPQAAAYARDVRGLDVRCGTLETVSLPAESFDVVYAWHVVEHFAHPLRTLQAVHRVLKPGGVFCFSVPNSGALEARVFRRYWAALDVPLHYYHYTPETISALLTRAGFGDPRIVHQANLANIVQSVGAVLDTWSIMPRLSRALLRCGEGGTLDQRLGTLGKPLAIGLAALKQGGRITVTAYRPE